MRNYRLFVRSSRRHFLVDPENYVHYYLGSDNTYFAAVVFGIVEEGIYYYFDGRYILCSEDVTPHIYE